MIPDKYVWNALMALKNTVIRAGNDGFFSAQTEKPQPQHVSLALQHNAKKNYWGKKYIQSNGPIIFLCYSSLKKLNISLMPAKKCCNNKKAKLFSLCFHFSHCTVAVNVSRKKSSLVDRRVIAAVEGMLSLL